MAFGDNVFPKSIRFGQIFELDLGAYELRRAGQAVKLGRIPMELLLFLVEQRGQLVTREQIVERVWGKDVFLDTDNSINAAIRKIRQTLKDDPERPRFVHTVIGRGYRFIAAIEEQSALPDSESSPTGKSAEASPGGKVLRNKLKLTAHQPVARWVGAVTVVTVAAIMIMKVGGVREWVFRTAAVGVTSTPKQARPSLAVLGFKNLSGKEEQAWISTALSEMMSADLAAGQRLRLVPGEDVSRMKVDLALPSAETYSAETLAKIHNHLNTDMVVLGSYLAVGSNAQEKIRVNLQVQDAKTAETIAVVSEDGTEADLSQLVTRTGDGLRRALRITGASDDEATQVRMVLPGNPTAARFYTEGLTKLRRFDALAARDLFIQAIAGDPNHALSHASLSECWSSLGYDGRAQEEAKKAFALSSALRREDQLSIEAQYRVAVHEWPRAMEIYRLLWSFFPDNPDYPLKLAGVQTAAGMGKDAIATIGTMERRSLPAAIDSRVDLAEAAASDQLGDFRRAEAAAARAVEKGRRQGLTNITARALLMRGGILTAMGDNTAAVVYLKEAQHVFSAIGDEQNVARTLADIAIVRRHQSNLSEARDLLEESLKISRRTGNKVSMMQALNNLGNVFWDQGNMTPAMEAYQQSLVLSQEIGSPADTASSLNNIGGLLTLQGRLRNARQMYDEALQLARKVGDQDLAGNVLGNIADLLIRQGQLAVAKNEAEDALTTDRQVGDKSMEGNASYQLASVLVCQGDITAGRSKHQEGATLRHDLGEKVNEGESLLALAQLQFEAGDVRGTESQARKLTVAFHEGSSADDESLSYSLLALALSAQGRSVEAKQAATSAMGLLPKVMDLSTRLQVQIADAYVEGLSSRAGSATPTVGRAIRSLESTRQDAKRLGYTGLELEARLRLGMLEVRTGMVSSGRARLEALQRDAQSKGFVYLARKASAAL
jgi:eukaryotic-like serine/threonine-protein kinase